MWNRKMHHSFWEMMWAESFLGLNRLWLGLVRKKQKRMLNDTMQRLHKQYLIEETNHKISYASFCRLRPFWVIVPSLKDRETCNCRRHDHFRFLLAELKRHRLVETDKIDDVIDVTSCDSSNKDSTYGECDECGDLEYTFPVDCDDNTTQVEWEQWENVTEIRKIKKGTVFEENNVPVMKKKKTSGSKTELKTAFQSQLQTIKRHVYTVRHQSKSIRFLIESLSASECMIHIDFAENFLCKYNTEVQSVHFGASKQQATMHTGVSYIGGMDEHVSFCATSESFEHGPAGIWAYMDPVLDHIREQFPHITTIHFVSDGPTAQYKQRNNFYMCSTITTDKGFQVSTWNLTAAGHGKGAPDGVGGALKRLVDRYIAKGNDISEPRELFKALLDMGTSVMLYYVDSDAVSELQKQVTQYKLPTLTGTMKMHQCVMNSLTVRSVAFRELSCLSSKDKYYLCVCFGAKAITYPAHPGHDTVENTDSHELNDSSIFEISVEIEADQSTEAINDNEMARALLESANIARYHEANVAGHTRRINAILKDCNPQLTMGSAPVDGDCLFHSVAAQTDMTTAQLRNEVCDHFRSNHEIYASLYPDKPSYDGIVNDLQTPGIWYLDICDLIPQVLTHILQRPIRIYSTTAGVVNPVVIAEDGMSPNENPLLLAFLDIPDAPHYNPCVFNQSAQINVSDNEEVMSNGNGAERDEGHDYLNSESHTVDALDIKQCIGRYCLVRYDDNLYVGKILGTDDASVEVTCMTRVGQNRFKWPRKDDICWYSHQDLVYFIPEPTKRKRHYSVDGKAWDNFQAFM